LQRTSLVTLPFVLAALTLFLGAQVPNLFVLAPRFLAGQGLDEQQIGVVMGAFNVAALAAMPLIGLLAGRVGRKALLIGACACASAGCVAFEMAGGVAAYAAARAAQGVGFGAALVIVLAYVAEVAPRDRLAQALGFAGVLTLVAQAIGPLLGEVLERVAGWPWVFRAGAIGAALGAAVAAFLPQVGAASARATSVTVRESAWVPIVATALAGFGFGAVWTFLADHADRVGVGVVTPFFAAYVVAAVGARLGLGHLADTLGRRAVGVPSLLCHAVALALLSTLGAVWHLVGIGFLFGLSHGLYYPTLQAMIVERAPSLAGARARAIAFSTFSFGLGITAGAFSLGVLAKSAGYPPIYLVAGGLSVVAAAVLAAGR
jgi:MFS family permease